MWSNMKSKIINIPRRYVKEEWGGTETVVLETSKELLKKGYDVKIFTSMALSNKINENVFDMPVNRFSYTYTRLGLSSKSKTLLDKRGGDLYSLPLFLKILFSKNVKVIHLHTTGRLGMLGVIAAKLKKIPCVVSIHGGILDIPKEQMDELINPSKGTFNWGKPFDIILQTKKVLDKVDGIITVGEKERDLLSEKYPGKKIVFIPNGVDENKFINGSRDDFLKKFDLEKDSNIILTVASYNTQKNQKILIEAFKKLKENNN
ncbi:MAG: glycosyltransferase, partial [Candidatus Delongbacteria bacterium]|nr:glycosyltransferase [Candidatus Delongbacteria bacterium]